MRSMQTSPHFGMQTDYIGVGQIMHDVKIVRRQIDYHAHIFDLSRKRTNAAHMDLVGFAECAVVQLFLERDDRGIKAFNVSDGQRHADFFCHCDQGRAFFNRCGDRFFDQCWYVLLKGVACDVKMMFCWDDDGNEVDRLAFQHHAIIRIGADVVSRPYSLQCLCHRIGNRNKFNILHLGIDTGMIAPHIACANDRST